MPSVDHSKDLSERRHLSPEQLAVENIKALMEVRGVSRAELARRLNDLGFTTWRHEKTIRNLFDGKRSFRVDELFGFAAALNTTLFALTSLDTQRAVYINPKPPKFDVHVGSYVLERFHYMDLWFGSPGAEVPTSHINWAGWKPGSEPLWNDAWGPQRDNVIQLYEIRGWELPAPENDLTPEDVFKMRRQLITASEDLDE